MRLWVSQFVCLLRNRELRLLFCAHTEVARARIVSQLTRLRQEVDRGVLRNGILATPEGTNTGNKRTVHLSLERICFVLRGERTDTSIHEQCS